MPTVTKRELVIELSNRTGFTQTQVFEVFQASLDLITQELAKGNEVTLRRFGTFEVRVSKPKIGRNPNQPGSEMKISRWKNPACGIAAFNSASGGPWTNKSSCQAINSSSFAATCRSTCVRFVTRAGWYYSE